MVGSSDVLPTVTSTSTTAPQPPPAPPFTSPPPLPTTAAAATTTTMHHSAAAADERAVFRAVQDSEYDESVRADMAARAAAQEAEREKENQRLRDLEAAELERALALSAAAARPVIPAEPATGGVMLVFNLGNGARVRRRFPSGTQLRVVVAFLQTQVAALDGVDFEIAIPHPARTLDVTDSAQSIKTLEALNLAPRSALLVRRAD